MMSKTVSIPFFIFLIEYSFTLGNDLIYDRQQNKIKQKTKSIVNITISLTGPQQTDSISFDYTPHYTDTPSAC